MIKVMIGVQARSTSSRLPGKSMALIDHITMTEHVLRACDESANHLNKRSNIDRLKCFVTLLVPYGDALVHEYGSKRDVSTGPEDDVLKRYFIAAIERHPDYICRITADCALMAPSIISKHILTAINNDLDYCSNAYEQARTFVDGYDVEVVSKKLFYWTNERAENPADREHVTTYLRRERPAWAKYGAIVGHIDISDIKLSVDTKEELETVRANKRSIMQKIKALKDDGISVFRF